MGSWYGLVPVSHQAGDQTLLEVPHTNQALYSTLFSESVNILPQLNFMVCEFEVISSEPKLKVI